jgi:acyl carrier protein
MIAAKLKTIFTEILREESIPAEERTRLNCLKWDSLNHLKLVVAIEQEFQITLTHEDIIDLSSFAMAVEIVTSKIK